MTTVARFRFGFALFAGLIITGTVLRPIERPVWRAHRVAEPSLRADARETAISQGITIGLLGGLRALTADLLWLRAYDAWERRDAPETTALLALATEVDPRPLSFWLNCARILAYDIPSWRFAEAEGRGPVSGARERRIAEEQAGLARRYLDRAVRFHPAHPLIGIERAGIELNVLRDTAAAAASYRRAAELPGAPYFAARIHGELLRRLGRKREALDWLVSVHRTLPPGDEAAAADLVFARIRDLERELDVAIADRYRGPAASGG